jgi:hypothetical protein
MINVTWTSRTNADSEVIRRRMGLTLSLAYNISAPNYTGNTVQLLCASVAAGTCLPSRCLLTGYVTPLFTRLSRGHCTTTAPHDTILMHKIITDITPLHDIVTWRLKTGSVQSEKHCRDVHCYTTARWTRFRSKEWTQNNRATVGGGDLYAVLPVVIKGGHVRTQFRSCKGTETEEREWSESSTVDWVIVTDRN